MSTRGRISATVLEAYENRSNVPATAAEADAAATETVTELAAETVAESVVETEAKPKRRTRKKATTQG